MKLNSIQFLRGTAALLVVYAHAIDLQMVFSVSRQQNFYYLQNFGAIGVDIFFAISGFIITLVADKYAGAQEGLAFLIKRFIRINPIYYIASLLYLIPLVWQFILVNRPMSGLYILNSLCDTILILPFNKEGQYLPLLSIGWTLGFEWLFYIIFIVLIVAKSKRKPLHLLCILLALVAFGKIASITDYRFVFLTNPIILEFLLGVLICWIYLRFNVNGIVSYFIIFLGVVGYIYSIIWGYDGISEAGNTLSGVLSTRRFIQWGVPSAAFVAGCVFLEKRGILSQFLGHRWIQLLGDASYSIYLTHLTVFAVITLGYRKLNFFPNADLSIFLHLCIASSIGVFFYLKVEKPLLTYLNRNYVRQESYLGTIAN